MKKKIILITLLVVVVLMLPACTQEAVPESASPSATTQTLLPEPAVTQTVIPAPSPAPESPVGNFRADNVYTTVDLPGGWAYAEGLEALSVKTLYGAVAFNSWGQPGFWVRSVVTNHSAADNPTPIVSYTFSDRDVMSQIPAGGAYVCLVEIHGPGMAPEYQPEEYTLNDLSGLIKLHDWRQDYSPQVEFFSFHKWGRSFQLVVACRADVSDATVTALNDLLQRWRFDEVPAGDPGWAVTVARKLLPEQINPLWFRSQSTRQMAMTVAYWTDVDVLTDKTVHFKFTYFWDVHTVTLSMEPPSDTYHWWEIDVLPTGEAILTAQGGEPLPPAISP